MTSLHVHTHVYSLGVSQRMGLNTAIPVELGICCTEYGVKMTLGALIKRVALCTCPMYVPGSLLDFPRDFRSIFGNLVLGQ